MTTPAPFHFFKPAKKADDTLPAMTAQNRPSLEVKTVPRPADKRYRRGQFYLKIEGLTGPRDQGWNSDDI
ncbi:MAG: hypothetical protein ACXU8U_13450 [Asticcacaulis sp.]